MTRPAHTPTQRAEQATIVSVPWPIRLFGDLQEHLGLPAITVAVDCRTAVRAVPRHDALFSIAGRGIADPIILDPRTPTDAASTIPSLARAFTALPAGEHPLTGGYDFQVFSRVPGMDNLLDSSILTVTWVVALSALAGTLPDVSGLDVAQLAAKATSPNTNPAWTWPETYACVLGGTLCIEHGKRPLAAALDRELPGMILGNCPGIANTGGTDMPRAAAASVERLEDIIGRAAFASASFDEIMAQLQDLTSAEAQAVYAHTLMRNQCRAARQLMTDDTGFDDDRLGELLDGAHEALRDYLGFRHERMEKLFDAASQAGALGFKLIPGTTRFVAFAPGKDDTVIQALRKAGGEAHAVVVTDGMRVERRSGTAALN